jgi:hypothetical protein
MFSSSAVAEEQDLMPPVVAAAALLLNALLNLSQQVQLLTLTSALAVQQANQLVVKRKMVALQYSAPSLQLVAAVVDRRTLMVVV